MTDNPIQVEQMGAVVTLRFNRPAALNAVNVALAEQFETAIATIAQDTTARVIVLEGSGRAFMAGGDLSIFRGATNLADTADLLIGPLHRAVLTLQSAPQIVLASLHGAVAGAGLSLALMADLAIADTTLKMNLAYARIHAVPDCGGSWALARLVGHRKAMEIALLSENLDADSAQKLGLVNQVVPFGQLRVKTAALAERLARQSSVSALGIRDLLRAAPMNSLSTQLDAERTAFRRATQTPEFAKSIDGFFARQFKS